MDDLGKVEAKRNPCPSISREEPNLHKGRDYMEIIWKAYGICLRVARAVRQKGARAGKSLIATKPWLLAKPYLGNPRSGGRISAGHPPDIRRISVTSRMGSVNFAKHISWLHLLKSSIYRPIFMAAYQYQWTALCLNTSLSNSLPLTFKIFRSDDGAKMLPHILRIIPET